MTQPQLIDQLRSIRSESGLSQSELADFIGMSQPSLSRFFANSGDVMLSTFLKVCHGLGVRIELIQVEPMELYRTTCCQFEPVRHGRADMRCGRCGRDVTLEMLLWDRVVNPDQVQNEDK